MHGDSNTIAQQTEFYDDVILLDYDDTLYDADGKLNTTMLDAVKDYMVDHPNAQVMLFSNYNLTNNFSQCFDAANDTTRITGIEAIQQYLGIEQRIPVVISYSSAAEEKYLGQYFYEHLLPFEEYAREHRADSDGLEQYQAIKAGDTSINNTTFGAEAAAEQAYAQSTLTDFDNVDALLNQFSDPEYDKGHMLLYAVQHCRGRMVVFDDKSRVANSFRRLQQLIDNPTLTADLPESAQAALQQLRDRGVSVNAITVDLRDKNFDKSYYKARLNGQTDQQILQTALAEQLFKPSLAGAEAVKALITANKSKDVPTHVKVANMQLINDYTQRFAKDLTNMFALVTSEAIAGDPLTLKAFRSLEVQHNMLKDIPEIADQFVVSRDVFAVKSAKVAMEVNRHTILEAAKGSNLSPKTQHVQAVQALMQAVTNRTTPPKDQAKYAGAVSVFLEEYTQYIATTARVISAEDIAHRPGTLDSFKAVEQQHQQLLDAVRSSPQLEQQLKESSETLKSKQAKVSLYQQIDQVCAATEKQASELEAADRAPREAATHTHTLRSLGEKGKNKLTTNKTEQAADIRRSILALKTCRRSVVEKYSRLENPPEFPAFVKGFQVPDVDGVTSLDAALGTSGKTQTASTWDWVLGLGQRKEPKAATPKRAASHSPPREPPASSKFRPRGGSGGKQ